ncbi:AMP-binding protein, partial [Paracoccus sp. (in: a-proteobacteria)]|uniref:AMP-binding protein n=1 Tax=Paracoccus sp. TaxID=267 RepID=UPI003A8ABBAC
LTAQPARAGQLPDGCRVVDATIFLDAPAADSIAPGRVSPGDSIYLVATSGTTGRPKCIPVTHDAALLSYEWRDAYTPYTPDMKIGIYIFAIWEMFRPLRNGAELCFPGLDDLLSPQSLARFITGHDLSEMLFTPSFFEKMLQGLDAATCATLPLRRIVLNGEVVSDRLIAEARAKLPHAALWNLYSICETHDICMSELTGPAGPAQGVTVGRAMPHLRPVVLDDHDRPCPPGTPGLLHFEGPRMLGPGYVNRPEETSRRFRELTLQGRAVRLYDTGDQGYVDADGQIVVLGRVAHMLKLRGHSIQTRELTETMAGLMGFSHAIPWVRQVGDQGQALVFYYTADATTTADNRARWQIGDDSRRTPDALARALRNVLPGYCVPSYLVQLDAIPIHEVSGKCDFKALPEIRPETCEPETAGDALPTVIHAARILQCRIAEIDPDRSFHDQGGDSLMCVDLILELERGYARRVDFDRALNLPLSRLHQLLSDQVTETARPQYDRRGILLTGATGFLGRQVLAAAIDRLPGDQAVYCLVRPRNRDPHQRLEAIAAAAGLPLDRIIPVAGSIDDPAFGLDPDHYAGLCRHVLTVIHCAATVNLAVDRATMLDWSRAGIAAILQFCHDSGADLRFSSSSAVFPETGGPHPEAPAAMYDACSGYGAAKIEAESQIAASGVSAAIVRLPSLYGLDAPNHRDIYEIILQASRAIGCLPEGLIFPMTDLHAAAGFLVGLRPGAGARFYNLIADDPVTADAGFERVSPDAWLARAPLPDLVRDLIAETPAILHADAVFENAAAKAQWQQAGMGDFAALSDGRALLDRRLRHHSEPALT